MIDSLKHIQESMQSLTMALNNLDADFQKNISAFADESQKKYLILAFEKAKKGELDINEFNKVTKTWAQQ